MQYVLVPSGQFTESWDEIFVDDSWRLAPEGCLIQEGDVVRRAASIFDYGMLGPKDEITSGDEIMAKLLPGGKEVDGIGFCWKEVDVVCPDMIGLCYGGRWDAEVLIRRKTFKQ